MSEKRHVPEIIKYAALSVGVFSATFIATGMALYHFVLSKSGLHSPLVTKVVKGNHEKHPLDEKRQKLEKVIDENAIWFDNAEFEKLEIQNRDGKTLHSRLLKAENGSDIYVICIHGYNSSPRKMGVYARHFLSDGYNVILPSLRGHADSEEEFCTMGWKDRLDVIDLINYLVAIHPKCRIILHGVSMGGATTMMVTGEDLPENVRVAVEDCGYTSVWDILSYKMKASMNLPEFPFLYSADTVNRRKEDFSFKQASCVEQLKKSKTPTLFIHGEADDFVPYSMLDEVYNAAACEKQKLSVPCAPHARSVCLEPEIYWNTINDFIIKYL